MTDFLRFVLTVLIRQALQADDAETSDAALDAWFALCPDEPTVEGMP